MLAVVMINISPGGVACLKSWCGAILDFVSLFSKQPGGKSSGHPYVSNSLGTNQTVIPKATLRTWCLCNWC